MFTGVYTALITPIKDNKIDYDSLNTIIEMQVKAGVDGVVPMGTTGESPTASFEEHKEIVRKVVEITNGRIKVIAGAGANSTEEAIWLSKEAEEAGVDGVLSVVPYYNKPAQRGIISHFEKIAKSIKIPVVIYNIPGRAGVNFQPESIKELISRVDNIVAVKDASGDISHMMRTIELCGDDLILLSGDDNLLLPILSIGGKGVISVISNLLPADVKRVIDLFNKADFQKSESLFYKLLPLCKAMFIETNPIPIKAAMEMAGYCSPEMRLPMTPLEEDNRKKLRKFLEEYGVKL